MYPFDQENSYDLPGGDGGFLPRTFDPAAIPSAAASPEEERRRKIAEKALEMGVDPVEVMKHFKRDEPTPTRQYTEGKSAGELFTQGLSGAADKYRLGIQQDFGNADQPAIAENRKMLADTTRTIPGFAGAMLPDVGAGIGMALGSKGIGAMLPKAITEAAGSIYPWVTAAAKNIGIGSTQAVLEPRAEGETIAGNAIPATAGAFAGSGIGKVFTKLVSPFQADPVQKAAADALRGEGVDVSLAQATGNKSAGMMEMLGSLMPVAGNVAGSMKQREQVTGLFTKVLDVPDFKRLTPDAMKAAAERIGAKYDELVAQLPAKALPPNFSYAINDAITKAEAKGAQFGMQGNYPGKQVLSEYSRRADDFTLPMDGTAYKELRTRMTEQISELKNAGTADGLAAMRQVVSARNALDKAADEMWSQASSQLKELNTKNAYLKVMEEPNVIDANGLVHQRNLYGKIQDITTNTKSEFDATVRQLQALNPDIQQGKEARNFYLSRALMGLGGVGGVGATTAVAGPAVGIGLGGGLALANILSNSQLGARLAGNQLMYNNPTLRKAAVDAAAATGSDLGFNFWPGY